MGDWVILRCRTCFAAVLDVDDEDHVLFHWRKGDYPLSHWSQPLRLKPVEEQSQLIRDLVYNQREYFYEHGVTVG